MAGTTGLEIFGDYEYHDDVLEKILQVGESYQIRQVGSKAYKTGKIGSGWFNASVPAIYSHENLEDYREWLGPNSAESELSVGGSFVSPDIEDYYMTPMERGQGHLVDLHHDFIGREALDDMINNQQRARVTLVWDREDVVDVYSSLFTEGETKKFIPLPDTAHQWSVAHYDVIRKNGKDVGFSKYPGYLYYKREMLSLASIDLEYSDPGTRVSFIWGESTEKLGVERHQRTKIQATVAESPYIQAGRR
jgi:vanillate/3-O-methylgallate O-demethylase